mmetsp:Transcript_13024/g.31941  ORF Transcript_13024/g.31941 Transcript_13024/m.31941 type:complete len:211 (+) Transcript_13024:658-1290(+)
MPITPSATRSSRSTCLSAVFPKRVMPAQVSATNCFSDERLPVALRGDAVSVSERSSSSSSAVNMVMPQHESTALTALICFWGTRMGAKRLMPAHESATSSHSSSEGCAAGAKSVIPMHVSTSPAGSSRAAREGKLSRMRAATRCWTSLYMSSACTWVSPTHVTVMLYEMLSTTPVCEPGLYRISSEQNTAISSVAGSEAGTHEGSTTTER